MRKIGKSFLVFPIFLFLLFLAGCAGERAASGIDEGKVVQLQYAAGFSIEYLSNGCKKVTDGDGRHLLLVPRGHQPPAGYGHLSVIYTPVKRVVVASTTEAALLRPLGELGSIIGVTTPENQWYITEVKEGMQNGSIIYLGNMNAPDYEKIKKLSPDVVFTFTQSMGSSEFVQKLGELGVPYAVDNEWLEKDPLGRLEWIKFLAAFYNKEDRAERYFNQAVKECEEIKAKIPADTRPRVVWGSIFKGKVYVPAGNSYVAKMIEMAGGDYAFKDVGGTKTGSITLSLEEFYARASQADIFVYASSPNYGINSVAKITDQAPVLAGIEPVKNSRVWCFQPWYWQDLDKTAVQIADLAAIFHPKDFPGYQVKEFMKLPRE